MKYFLPFYLIIHLQFCSCSPLKEDNSLLTFDPTKIKLNDIKLSDIADEITYIQLDSTVLLSGFSKSVLFTENSIFLYCPNQGIFRYDQTGKFQSKIGGIGQGPGEYDQYSSFITGEIKDELFVKTFSNDILSYDLKGKFLDKIKIQKIPENSYIKDAFYFNDHFYLFYYIEPECKKPYMWSIANASGEVISSKQDISFDATPRVQNEYFLFSPNTASFNGESLLYWGEYNDTIFEITKENITPFCLWADGDFRMTTKRVQNKDFVFYAPMNVLNLNNYILFYMAKTFRPSFFVYNKQTGLFIGTEKPLIDDINGGPGIEHISSSFRLNGYDYLKVDVQPYDLKDALVKSDTPKSRELAETIDDEGNPVLVLIRLKKCIY